jgi:peptide/nickel transport system substrate-binding protein
MDRDMNRQDKNLSSSSTHPRTPRRATLSVIAAAMALTLAVVLSACGGGSSTTGAAGGTSGTNSGNVVGAEAATVADTTSTPKQGGTINYAHEQETPCLTGGWVQEAFIERQYADELVSQTKTGKIVPWLATSWDTSKDGLTWTFHLKPGVKFTNGEPLDAKAVVKNFEYWSDPSNGNGVAPFLHNYYKSSKAINPTTVQVTLFKPYAPLLSSISQGYDGILAPATYAAGPEAICNEPIGSGPWIIDKWTHGQNITFSRNPNYNSAPSNALHQGPAYAEKLIWSYVADPTTRYGSLTTGQSNVIYDVPAPDWASAQENYEVQQYITPGRPVTLDLNTNQGPFAELPVREAFAYGADRKAAVESAFEGKVPYNGNGALSQSTPMQDASLEETWPYNPEKAEQLLDQAGWKVGSGGIREKDGKQLNIKLVYGAGSLITTEGATVLEDLQSQWKEVGFNVELKPATLTQLFSGEYAAPDKYDATIGYWTSPSPAVLLIVWKPWNSKTEPNGNNQSFYNSDKLVSLIEKGNSTADPAEQKKNYYAAQQIVTKEQAAVVGVYVQETSLAVEKNLHDVWLEASQGEPVFSDAYFGNEG